MPKSLKRLSSDSFRRTRSRKRADDDGPRPLPQYHVWRDEPGQNVERGIEEGVARGVHGETRNDGEMMANGENGVNEEREINGETRVTEEDGVSGERGINEETRVRGEDGVNEERGIDEDTGVEENNEERGLDGETAVDVEAEILQERGADGKDTANGERGLDGQEYVVNGERESNGANGINGESGVDGEDRVDGEVDREVQGTDNLSVNRADSPSSGPSDLGPQDNCKLAGPLASPRNGAISPRALTPPRNREIRRRDDDDDGAPSPEPISKRAKLLRRRTNARCEGLTTSVPTIIEPLRRSNSAPEIIVNLEET
ncbi:uncharacterized protein IWZ02DRAFT_219582 [Phyllosticta citriasiana]|uniref:uncharacterized protein n=1 Tax=Phyllosticta citriasiana TaxID=595635 RepID=UPI0030FDD983